MGLDAGVIGRNVSRKMRWRKYWKNGNGCRFDKGLG